MAAPLGPGLDPAAHGPGNQDGDFDGADPARAAEDVATYRATLDECRAAAATHPLDERVPRRAGDPASEPIDVRWIYLHLLEEYARHNGHADLLGQAIDGTGE